MQKINSDCSNRQILIFFLRHLDTGSCNYISRDDSVNSIVVQSNDIWFAAQLREVFRAPFRVCQKTRAGKGKFDMRRQVQEARVPVYKTTQLKLIVLREKCIATTLARFFVEIQIYIIHLVNVVILVICQVRLSRERFRGLPFPLYLNLLCVVIWRARESSFVQNSLHISPGKYIHPFNCTYNCDVNSP